MNKVEELEKKWFKYKVKQMISPLMRVSVFSLVIAGSYYLYEENKLSWFSVPLSDRMTNVLGVNLEVNASTVDQNISVPKEEPIELAKPMVEEKEIEKLALAPIIPVIDMEKEERISDVKRQKSKKSAAVVHAKPNSYLTAKELAVISSKAKKVENTAPRKTKKMDFKTTSVNYLETMKAKFSKSKNPREALIIAKAYYKKSKYKESEKWAFSANKLDNSLEESWLLFAKSKAKLGQKQEALKILVSYYKKSQSNRAKRAISQIKTGKI